MKTIHKSLLSDFFKFAELNTRQATTICSPANCAVIKITKSVNCYIYVFIFFNFAKEHDNLDLLLI